MKIISLLVIPLPLAIVGLIALGILGVFLAARWLDEREKLKRCWGCGQEFGSGGVNTLGKDFCRPGCIPGRIVSKIEDYRRESALRVN